MDESELNKLDWVLYGSCWNLRPLLEDRDSLRRLYQAPRHTSSSSDVPRTTAEMSELMRVRSQESVVFDDIQTDAAAFRNSELITASAHYHPLFRTHSGRLGLALHTVREGDVVAIVAGVQQPIILRPRGNDYKFVSIGYIPEIMDGSLWSNDTQELYLR